MIKNKAVIVLIIFSLSITYAFMHFAFLAIRPENIHAAYKGQESLVFNPQGREDARILIPYLLFFIHSIVAKDSAALILAEIVVAFFSFAAVFLLSKKIVKDDAFSLLAVMSTVIFSPLAFQHALHRFGEVLLIGFYPMLIFLILEKKELLYIAMLFVASLQRPELAICSILFKVIYDWLNKQGYMKLIYNISIMIIPFLIVGIINYYYNISTAKYILAEAYRTLQNLQWFWYYVLVYSPVVFLSICNYKKFGRLIYLMLFSLIPYLISITIAGAFAESRLFLPLATICIIGICFSVKSKGEFTLGNLL